jgi:hypothetical protein
MKCKIYIVLVLLLFSFFSHAQTEVASDSVENPQTRKEKKAERKEQKIVERKALTQHFRFSVAAVYASLNSTVRFEGPKGLFSTQIDFEKHVGLEDRKFIYAGTFTYRITPRSGLFASYYRLYRQNSLNLEDDIVYEGDTLKKGLLINGYFNTDVFSIGYLLSILKEEKSFFGVYFNLYVINIQAGIRSEVFEFDKSTGVLAPLPNFGFLAVFQLKKWMTLSSGLGIFFLNTNGLNGSFLDVNAVASFYPTKWLGLNIGYYIFDVKVGLPVDQLRAIASYNYGGPSFGVAFKF